MSWEQDELKATREECSALRTSLATIVGMARAMAERSECSAGERQRLQKIMRTAEGALESTKTIVGIPRAGTR